LPPSYEFQLKVYDSEAAYRAVKEAEERMRREREEAEKAQWQATAVRYQREQQEIAQAAARLAFKWAVARWITIALVVAFPFLVGLYARRRYRMLRGELLLLQSTDTGKPEPPGLISARFIPAVWTAAIRSALGKARQALEGLTDDVGRKAFAAVSAAVAEPALADISRETAAGAVRTAELQSRLVSVSGLLIYILVFPETSRDALSVRSHTALADSWLAHVGRLRRGLIQAGRAPDVLSLIFFLAPDVKGGSLCVSYDSDAGRLVSADLVRADAQNDASPPARIDSWGFTLGDS
jgi:hypothetical protein